MKPRTAKKTPFGIKFPSFNKWETNACIELLKTCRDKKCARKKNNCSIKNVERI